MEAAAEEVAQSCRIRSANQQRASAEGWADNKMSKSCYLNSCCVRAARTWAVLFHPAPRQTPVGLVAVPHRLGDECAGLVAHGRRRVAAVINSGLALLAVGVPLHACSSHGIQRIVGGRDGSLPSRIVADQALARRYRHSRGALPLRPLHHCKRVNLRVLRLTERFRVLRPVFQLAVRKGGLAVGGVAGI